MQRRIENGIAPCGGAWPHPIFGCCQVGCLKTWTTAVSAILRVGGEGHDADWSTDLSTPVIKRSFLSSTMTVCSVRVLKTEKISCHWNLGLRNGCMRGGEDRPLSWGTGYKSFSLDHPARHPITRGLTPTSHRLRSQDPPRCSR